MKWFLVALVLTIGASAQAEIRTASTCTVTKIMDNSVFGADLDTMTHNQVSITINGSTDFTINVGTRTYTNANAVLESDAVPESSETMQFVMISTKADPSVKFMFMIPTTPGTVLSSAIGYFNLDRGVETYPASMECR